MVGYRSCASRGGQFLDSYATQHTLTPAPTCVNVVARPPKRHKVPPFRHPLRWQIRFLGEACRPQRGPLEVNPVRTKANELEVDRPPISEMRESLQQ